MVKCYVIKLFTADVAPAIPFFNNRFAEFVFGYLTTD